MGRFINNMSISGLAPPPLSLSKKPGLIIIDELKNVIISVFSDTDLVSIDFGLFA
jgi:hypothetical protein